MKKKKSGGGGANWMDTYGDMVTLLLCFFVLLYSMSTISEEAWKNLVMSFNPYAVMNGEAQGGGGPSADDDQQGVLPAPPDNPNDPESPSQAEIDNMMASLYQDIKDYIDNEAMAANISVEMDGGRVFVRFKDTAFFDPNSSDLRPDAYPILDAMCDMLEGAGYAIDEVLILGHTAEAPGSDAHATVRQDRFLSSDRATNVVVYIMDHTEWDLLDPGKLHGQGMGQWHPIDTNDTEEGRSNNRRVEMIISGRNLEEEIGSGLSSFET